MSIGERIKEARQAAGLSQQQLADRIGIAASGGQRIYQWEADNRIPKADAITRIAQATSTSAAWIMFGEESQK